MRRRRRRWWLSPLLWFAGWAVVVAAVATQLPRIRPEPLALQMTRAEAAHEAEMQAWIARSEQQFPAEAYVFDEFVPTPAGRVFGSTFSEPLELRIAAKSQPFLPPPLLLAVENNEFVRGGIEPTVQAMGSDERTIDAVLLEQAELGIVHDPLQLFNAIDHGRGEELVVLGALYQTLPQVATMVDMYVFPAETTRRRIDAQSFIGNLTALPKEQLFYRDILIDRYGLSPLKISFWGTPRGHMGRNPAQVLERGSAILSIGDLPDFLPTFEKLAVRNLTWAPTSSIFFPSPGGLIIARRDAVRLNPEPYTRAVWSLARATAALRGNPEPFAERLATSDLIPKRRQVEADFWVWRLRSLSGFVAPTDATVLDPNLPALRQAHAHWLRYGRPHIETLRREAALQSP